MATDTYMCVYVLVYVCMYMCMCMTRVYAMYGMDTRMYAWHTCRTLNKLSSFLPELDHREVSGQHKNRDLIVKEEALESV